MLSKQFLNTVSKFIKFILIIIIIDFACGFIASQLFFSQKTGKFARSTYAINTSHEDILVLGSSHAHRHYVPEILEQTLHKTCYNAGADGQHLVYQNAIQEMTLKRRIPKMIILNIDEFFLYKAPKAYDRLNDLHPYYNEFSTELKPFLELNTGYADPKLLFKAYQNNSTLIQIVKYFFIPQQTHQGYRPLYGKMTPYKLENRQENPTEIIHIEEIDPILIQAFKEFILKAKTNNITLVFVTSPNLIEKDLSKNESLKTIKRIIKAEEIPFFDYINSEAFIGKLDLFYDHSHLNDDGARYFTEQVANQIKTLN